MKGFEMRKLQAKLKPSDPMFWQIECAAQLESVKRSLQGISTKLGDTKNKNDEDKKPKPKSITRKYYAIEYVPSYPAKLDWIGRTIPTDGHYDHVVSAYSLIAAKQMLEAKLNAERAPDPRAVQEAIQEEEDEEVTPKPTESAA
jgi:hypothetical protein